MEVKIAVAVSSTVGFREKSSDSLIFEYLAKTVLSEYNSRV